MLQLPIIHQGTVIGQCTLVREGLYWRLHCRCRSTGAVVRLYADGRSVGVPQPRQEELLLCRRLSVSGWPQLPPKSGCLTCTPLEPWQGTAAGLPMPAGFCRREGTVTCVLFPYDPSAPCPSMALLCFYTIRDGFWQLRLDENQMPIFP